MSKFAMTQPPVTYQEVVNLLATLPLERLNSVYDFDLFLEYQPLVPIPETDIFGATHADIRADEERWNQQFADSRDKLSALAHEAAEEFRQGRTKPMQFAPDGVTAHPAGRFGQDEQDAQDSCSVMCKTIGTGV
ncbi:MAG: hypothetical protein WA077_21750 [Anaerolineae bacterium]